MDATSTKALRLQNAPINSGTGAVARFLGKFYPGLVRPHALHQSSVGQEHPFGTAIGGSLVPPISPSSWPYVEPVFREVFTAYLGTSPLGAPPLPDVAGAEEPALAPQITAASRYAVPPQATLTSSPLSTTRPSTPWPKSAPWSPAPSPPSPTSSAP